MNEAPASGRADLLVVGAVAAVAAASLLLWLATGLAALAVHGAWPAIELADAPRALLRLAAHLDAPRYAWPTPVRAELAGPAATYAIAVGLLVAGSAAALMVARRMTPSQPRPEAAWARGSDLASLRVAQPWAGRLTLGRHGQRLLAAETRQSVLVVAPTQTGKTTGLAVPAILEWPGPVVATSIKTDLLRDTLSHRSRLGRVDVFDPSGVTGLEGTSSWTPLAACDSWGGARRAAAWLSGAAGPARRGLADADFWYTAAAKLLAPLLFAAASSGRTMADVVAWVDTQESHDVLEALQDAKCDEAMRAMEATWQREERQRSSIYTTAETVLDAYADPGVLAASTRADISPATLLDGGAHTVYLSATIREQQRLRPVFVTLIQEIVEHLYADAARTGRPADPPLLLVLDEAANIAPLPDLDVLAATGAGQGLQLLTVLQDLAQAHERWGRERADTIVNNHRARIFGAGVADERTLGYLRHTLGDERVDQVAHTVGGGRRTATTSTVYRALAPADAIRQAATGSAVLVYGNLPPARLTLRLWHQDRALRELVARSGPPMPA